MKKIYRYSFFATLALLATGCANEAPFSPDREEGKDNYGEFHKSALSFDVKDESGIQVQTRAEGVDINDFQLEFRKVGGNSVTYTYGKMPEVMMLEQGTYQVFATHGADLEAEWDNPYFTGMSGEFSVTPQSITTSIDPIVCTLQNVKVTVSFDKDLAAAASDDSYIEVKVGSGNGLKYYKDSTKNRGKAGYFKCENEHTLVATFYGSINGVEMGSQTNQETKALSDISGGNHYKMTFSLHHHNGAEQGAANANVSIDGSVDYVNIENNVVVTDQKLEDVERPKQEDPEDPNAGDDPGTLPTENGPVITAEAPINLDEWNENPSACKLTVTSATGITGFIVDIVSPILTPEELEGPGLSSHLDLIEATDGDPDNPKDLSDGLESLGFPYKDQVKNQKKVMFDISNFIPLMMILDAADHTFVLKVTDAAGSTEKELKIRIKK